MPVPRTPAIHDFFPMTTRVVVNGDRYLETTSQSDVQVRVYDVATGSLVFSTALGSASTHYLGDSIGPLVEGRLYRAQIRYENASGWSSWSLHKIAQVPAELDFERLAVPEEPAANGAIPINPSFPLSEVRRFTFREWILEAGGFMRRHVRDFDRRRVSLVWAGLTAAEVSTVETFVRARLDADPPEAFTIDDPDYAGRAYFPRAGTLDKTQRRNKLWRLAFEAIETTPDGEVWTVGSSTVEGGDHIR